jgi:glycosyltransferase involved in cell wall biosynthesis
VFFYFHWINNPSKKLKKLKEIAKKQPNLMILGTTQTVLDVFKKAGFQYAEVAPYPISKEIELQSTKPSKFSRVLFAGAARQDKGFSKVVDLIEYEKAENSTIPFFVQSSSEHYNKYDKKTQHDIKRLSATGYKNLTIHKDTLSESKYLDLFIGSICIQPYDPIAFADRVSGVTLDALLAGSPILTSADTWTAKIVEKFGAGIVMASNSPEKMHAALIEIINKYELYSNNARNAFNLLQAENDSAYLFSLMLD